MATVEHHHASLIERRGRSRAVDALGVEAQTIARRVRAAGSSFYWAMRLLPAPRRHSMYALTKSDAGAIADYLKSLPPVSHKGEGPFGSGDNPPVPRMMVVFPAGNN